MLRFVKKRWKKSRESSTPALFEDPTHQIADIGAEYGEGSDGEYHFERSGLVGPMGPMRSQGQISTTEWTLGLQLRTEGLKINSFLRRIPQP